MIISASRRTDIPAFHSDWFLNRIKDEYVYVRNPMNYNQISKVSLRKQDIECIVFWTKNPLPLMKRLNELDGYNYYFQFTLTSYDDSIEIDNISKSKLIPIFKELSNKIGKDKVIWRYDPIIISDKIDLNYHIKNFELIASKLSNYTDKCVISFLDSYKNISKRIDKNHIKVPTTSEMLEIASTLSSIAKKYRIIIETCSEKIDLSQFGIKHGKCIDDEHIRKLFCFSGYVDKDSNQREECGCVKSIDIGAYNTCMNNCIYCYANFSNNVNEKSLSKCNPKSPVLVGEIDEKSKISERKIEKVFSNQISLFKND